MTERKTIATRVRPSLLKKMDMITKHDIKNKKKPYSKATMADLAINDGIEKYCKDNDLSIKELDNFKKAQNKKSIISKSKTTFIKLPKKTYSINKKSGNKIEDVFISGN